MTLWQIGICAGVIFVILELFMPFTFFLSMAIGAFLTALVSVWVVSKTTLIIIFAITSVVSLIVFRPFLAKNQKTEKHQETGIEGKYIGSIAKVLKTVNKTSGYVSIYGERWEARSIDDEVFEENSEVEIVKNDSLIMYVKKLDKE